MIQRIIITDHFYPEVGAVPKATIIRAMAVDEKGNTSKTVTKTYFVDKNLAEVYKNASVISVVTDPDNLLSEEKRNLPLWQLGKQWC